MSGHVRPEVIAPDLIGDGRGRAKVPGDFQCRSVLLQFFSFRSYIISFSLPLKDGSIHSEVLSQRAVYQNSQPLNGTQSKRCGVRRAQSDLGSSFSQDYTILIIFSLIFPSGLND